MKRLITLILAVILVLSVCGCSPVNDRPVAVLWAQGSVAVDPNSLINAMDRAMYIENVDYTYYGAQGDAAKQLQQAEEALAAGCAALLVEPVDPAAAEQFAALAKAKDIPVIFFGKAVDKAVTESYAKCYIVTTDEATLTAKRDEMIAKYLKDEKTVEKLDRNKDGKIAVADLTGAAFALKVEGVEFLLLDGAAEIDPQVTELVLTADDVTAQQVLVALQAKDYNTDKLTTQYVAIFTVGNTVDYKALVLQDAPTGEAERKAHFEENKFLCDLTTVDADAMEELIFSTIHVIDTGRIAGTVLEDQDGIAEAVAKLVSDICKGKTAAQTAQIPYTTHAS